jgi:hypothetical protein
MDKKIAIVQNALEKYIVGDANLPPNYRKNAEILKKSLFSAVWNDIDNNNLYFLCMIQDSLKKLNSENPNDNYENMISEINYWINNDD